MCGGSPSTPDIPPPPPKPQRPKPATPKSATGQDEGKRAKLAAHLAGVRNVGGARGLLEPASTKKKRLTSSLGGAGSPGGG